MERTRSTPGLHQERSMTPRGVTAPLASIEDGSMKTALAPLRGVIALTMCRWYRLGQRSQLDHRLMAGKPPACMSRDAVQRVDQFNRN